MKGSMSDKPHPRAVVLLSGGMDSCVTASLAAKDHDVYALHASYGQRTQQREKRAFREVARSINASETLEVDLQALAKIGASSLVDKSAPIPTDGETGGIPSTYVPFRNGVLLSLAVAWAESVEAESVFIGAVGRDQSQGYPDTTREFFDAFENAANIGTRPETKVKIVVPLVKMTKTEVVKRGLELGAPLEHTWSCFQADEVACGVCMSCRGRKKAFREAGVEDKVPYEVGEEH